MIDYPLRTTLINVRIHSLHFDERFVPYFEVIDGGMNIIKIRVPHSSTDVMEWLEAHQEDILDVVLVPYRWMVGNQSGVYNRFHHVQVHTGE